MDRNRTGEELATKVLAQAAELDAVEDAADVADPQQEPPASVVDPALRQAELAAARQRLEAAKARLDAMAAERTARFEARSAQPRCGSVSEHQLDRVAAHQSRMQG